jgi:hypothetical protein
VVKIDLERNLLYLLGNAPGPIGGLVRVRDAVKKIDKQWWDLQYPSLVPSMTQPEAIQTWDGGSVDPFETYIHENDVVSGAKDDD